MKIRVTVDLEMIMLGEAGDRLPDPQPGTFEHDEAMMAAREAIYRAVKYGETAGFVHDLSDFSSVVVGRVEAGVPDRPIED